MLLLGACWLWIWVFMGGCWACGSGALEDLPWEVFWGQGRLVAHFKGLHQLWNTLWTWSEVASGCMWEAFWGVGEASTISGGPSMAHKWVPGSWEFYGALWKWFSLQILKAGCSTICILQIWMRGSDLPKALCKVPFEPGKVLICSSVLIATLVPLLLGYAHH